MDYEKKYKEALERARKSYVNSIEQGWTCDKAIYEEIFPELKESEDEKIRKILIKGFQHYDKECKWGEFTTTEILSWLEKQGEQKPFDYENANIQQKDFAPKVEPKFNEGDWITFYGDEPFKILKVEPELNGILDYLLLSQNGRDSYYNKNYVDTNARHWTIQDAKDGDVLAAHECLVLFREIDGLNIRCYCTYHFMNNPSFYVNTLQNKDAFHPATKEQRDQLEKAMADAGYTFDFEKKELKEIEEQNPAWSEEDERHLNTTIAYLKDAKEFKKTAENCINWLKSLKDRVLPQPKQGEQESLCDKCRKEHPSHSCQDITELGRCAVDNL